MTIEKDLIELIKSKLPEAEVGAIKNLVEELEQTKLKLTQTQKDLDSLTLSHDSYKKERDELVLQKSNWETLQKDIIKLQKDKDDFELEKVKKDLELEKVKSNFFKETVDKILKVPAVRETYQNELSYENGRDAYGNSTSIVRTVIPKEKTITKE